MKRSDSLARLPDASESWDIAIIGGGATGLGIAVDAASRGYRTALVERADFAESTSSKSTKLIHGGVRYLRGGEVGLVRESLRERGRLLRNAPGLGHPLSFVVPGYRWFEPFFYGSGLVLYDLLAGDLGIRSTEHLSPEATRDAVPNLRGEGLRGGTLYWDGQFDDARLAVAMAETATRHGAALANHVGAVEFIKESGRVAGVVARDNLSGDEIRIRAKVVVSAAGVFTDEVAQMDDPGFSPMIAPSQGIHLVLGEAFLGGQTGVMIPDTDDGRVLFAIPWMGRTLLGTTDTGGVAVELNPRPLEEEIDYLLEHVGRYLTTKPSRRDILSSFAGLRPLVKPKTDAGSTSRISRSHHLSVSGSGLVTMAGGKWTTYRQMAEDAVDLAAEVGGLERRRCISHDLRLSEEGEVVEEGADDRIDPALPYTWADVDRAVDEEMAMLPGDVLGRRTRSLYLDADAAMRVAPEVIRRMADRLGESETWIAKQQQSLDVLRGEFPVALPRG